MKTCFLKLKLVGVNQWIAILIENGQEVEKQIMKEIKALVLSIVTLICIKRLPPYIND